MFEWFRKYPATLLVFLLSFALILSGLFYSAWWGPVATGVIIGIGSYVFITIISQFYLEKLVTNELQLKIIPWNAFITTLLIALIARQISRNNLAWPVQLQTPNFFHPKSFFLLLITIFLVVLLYAFRNSVGRGEGVAIESHWGGLGGGIGGFRLSTPLIYLLGIVSLLVVMAAIGWQAYLPPPTAEASASPTPSPSPSPSSTPAASSASPPPAASPSTPTSGTPNINRSASPANP